MHDVYMTLSGCHESTTQASTVPLKLNWWWEASDPLVHEKGHTTGRAIPLLYQANLEEALPDSWENSVGSCPLLAQHIWFCEEKPHPGSPLTWVRSRAMQMKGLRCRASLAMIRRPEMVIWRPGTQTSPSPSDSSPLHAAASFSRNKLEEACSSRLLFLLEFPAFF